MKRNGLLGLIVFGLLLTALAPAAAQDAAGTVVADGLVNPRNMSYDSEGNLYVAEAGNGGPQATSDDTPFGSSSQITRIAPDGTKTAVVTGLISYRAGNSLGAHDVVVTDDSIWVLLGETSDFRIPFTHALVELDKQTGRVKTFVDLLTPELELDPDGNPNQQSNPVDFTVASDGTILIANAGCNCLMSWTPASGVQIAAVWPQATDNPVPTAVDTDAEGNVYVGFLSGFPWPEGGARIEKWSGGQLVETFSGLTAVTGMLVTDDGTIYAVESGLSAEGPKPGRVVMVSASGLTPVLEGLAAPYGLAQAPNGTIVVSVGSIGGQNGQVIAVPGM